MAAIGILSYPVRDSFSTYRTAPSQPRIYQDYRPASRPGMATSTNSTSSQFASNTPSSEDCSRMSLPSISNLLGIADANRTDASQGQDAQRTNQYYPSQKRARYETYPQQGLGIESTSNVYPAPEVHHAAQASYSRYSPLNDGQSSSHTAYSVDSDQGPKRHSQAAYETSPYSSKPYAASPSAASDGSLYSPTATMHRQMPYASQNMQNYPQSAIGTGPMSTSNPPASTLWEHHHYIGPSAQQGMYPPLPDRYICPTCNKAFSRPSSLKIHSHSHTGEKPFKCPHAGCGKAFSVKSNMKRHEKGCHTGGEAVAGAYMQDGE